jgi:hypothetical protein
VTCFKVLTKTNKNKKSVRTTTGSPPIIEDSTGTFQKQLNIFTTTSDNTGTFQTQLNIFTTTSDSTGTFQT